METLNGASSWLAVSDRHIRWGRTQHGPDWLTIPGGLDDTLVRQHFAGQEVIGTYPAVNGVAYFGVIDVDLHLADGEVPSPEQIARNERYAIAKARELEARGVTCLLVRGHDEGSYHIFFRVVPMAGDRLGRWLRAFIADAATVGVHVDTFPSETGDGNAVRLPGRHHRRPDQWSAAWTGGGWAAWPAPMELLTQLPPNAAKHFDAPKVEKLTAVTAAVGQQPRPGDLFNLTVPVEDVLTHCGWKFEREDGDRTRFTRPGKDGGVSASVQGGTVWVFTSSVPELPASRKGEPPYTAFAVIAHLCFRGDFKKAAAELAKRGFCPLPPAGRESEASTIGQRRGPRYDPIPEYVPFPTDCLPAPWAEFVRQGAHALRCDEAFVALPVMAVLGGAIGNTRRAYLGAEWFEPAVVWSCVVGDSGDRKSPAAALATDLVAARQKRLVKEFKAAMQEYRRAAAEHKKKMRDDPDGAGDPPEKPNLSRVLVSDVTIEKLAGLLDDNRRGLTLYRDELAGWFGGHVRYAKTPGASDEPHWLSIHRAGALIYDRKTGDKTSVFVPGAAVSITGGIQPGTLARLATRGLFESGLVARILFAMPPRRAKGWTDDRIADDVKEAAARSLDALYDLAGEPDEDGDERPVVVKLAPAARDRLKGFVNHWGAVQFEAEGDMAAALSKLEALVGRFALIHHVTTRAADLTDTDPIGLDSLDAGVRMARWFANEAERVYRVIHQPQEQREVRLLVELVRRIASKHGGRLRVAQLQNANGKRFRTADDAKLALEQLAALGLGEWEEGEAPKRGGHRPLHFVLRDEPILGQASSPMSDSSDSRPSEDEPDDGDSGLSDGRGGPPDAPPPPRPGDSLQPVDESGCYVAGTPIATTRESEESGVGLDRATGNRGQGAEPAAGPSIVQAPEASIVRTVPVPRPAFVATMKLLNPPGRDLHTNPAPMTTEPAGYTLVTDAAGVGAVVAAVEDGGTAGIDCETTGLDPRTDRVRLLQVATPGGVYVIDLFALPDPAAALAELFEALARVQVVAHNAAFELAFLAPLGFVPGRVFCTMVVAQVIDHGTAVREGARRRFGLADVARRYLDRELDKAEQKSDWSRAVLTPEQLAYAVADAAVLLPLADRLREEIKKVPALAPAVELEMRALPGIAWAGPVGFDRTAWEAIADAAEADAKRLADEMAALVPNPGGLFDAGWKWNSPEQVKAAFKAVGVTLDGTDDNVLAGVSHPLAGLLRDYREATKRAGTYGRAWVKKHVRGGTVRPSWQQLGAGSGRMSCSDPNIQNIPRGPAYRRCFTAAPGRVLVKADYSQIELRIAAKLANETVMIRAYATGRDLHRMTAASVLRKPEADVTKGDRQLAKAVNFGLLYGMGARGLQMYAAKDYGVSLTLGEATAYKEAFFAAYPALRRWHSRTRDELTRLGSRPYTTQTLAQRRTLLRAMKPGTDGGKPRANINEALNFPVQGTGADGLKEAVALLWERRAECPGAVPVIFCHDEIVVECDEARQEETAAWLRRAMHDGMAPLIDPVPVEIDVTVGRTWGG